jgi:hypothetical protein
MIHFTDATGLAGNALALVAACLLLPGVSRLKGLRLALLLGAVAAIALIPFGGLPLAAYLRGAIGDLSITSVLLLLLVLARPLLGLPISRPRSIGLALIVLGALVLYPKALGLGAGDPYRLGYGDVGLLAGLLILALTALWRRLPGIALGLALPVAAWAAGWYESSNLWDYLLDPLVAIYAAAALLRRGVGTLRSTRGAGG